MKCGICGKDISGGIPVENACLKELQDKNASLAAELKDIQQRMDIGRLVALPANLGCWIISEDGFTYEITGVSWGVCEPLKFVAVGVGEGHEGEIIEFEADELGDDYTIVKKEITRCRECGCTNFRACPGGCYWVEPDLCSRCAEKKRAAAK